MGHMLCAMKMGEDGVAFVVKIRVHLCPPAKDGWLFLRTGENTWHGGEYGGLIPF